MTKFVVGLISGIALGVITVALYAMSGRAPVGSSDAPLPFEELIAKTALDARIRREMPATIPVEANETVLLAGAVVYRNRCAMCHGLPNQAPPIIAGSMFPRVPQLFKPGRRVHPAGEIFWQAKNGIRLSGMPAFGSSLSDSQLWSVSLLLTKASEIPASVRQALVIAPGCVNCPDPQTVTSIQ